MHVEEFRPAEGPTNTGTPSSTYRRCGIAGLDFVNTWLGGHILASEAVNKPFVLEEFGVVADNNDASRAEFRDPVYRCLRPKSQAVSPESACR